MTSDKYRVEETRVMDVSRLFGLEYSATTEGSVVAADLSEADLAVEFEGRSTVEVGSGATVVFSWPDLGTIRVVDGRRIETDLVADFDPAAVRNIVLGIAAGTLLSQRGYLVLHGSVVEVDGEATAFVGPKRAGKSTSAAALCARGHGFLADDVVAVRFDDGVPVVQPAFPLLKLDHDAFAADALPARPAQNPDTGYGKRYYELDGFDWAERPLARICVFDHDADERVTPLRGSDATMALLGHAWPVRLRTASYVDDERSTLSGPDLDRCARLAEACRVQRLAVEQDHDTLDALGRDLEAILSSD